MPLSSKATEMEHLFPLITCVRGYCAQALAAILARIMIYILEHERLRLSKQLWNTVLLRKHWHRVYTMMLHTLHKGALSTFTLMRPWRWQSWAESTKLSILLNFQFNCLVFFFSWFLLLHLSRFSEKSRTKPSQIKSEWFISRWNHPARDQLTKPGLKPCFHFCKASVSPSLQGPLERSWALGTRLILFPKRENPWVKQNFGRSMGKIFW